jgi:hypothetical protein
LQMYTKLQQQQQQQQRQPDDFSLHQGLHWLPRRLLAKQTVIPSSCSLLIAASAQVAAVVLLVREDTALDVMFAAAIHIVQTPTRGGTRHCTR